MNSFVKSLFSGRMLFVFLYGISSGLPLALTGSTLKALMAESNVDLTVIGIFSLMGTPYTLKFLWSPLMDRFVPPFLGRRRGWIVICQAGIILGLLAMSTINPVGSPALMAILAFYVAFMSASQDIVIDAYRREILPDNELGLGSSYAVNGYRIGMLLSGAFALILADHVSWHWVYVTMAGIIGVAMVMTIVSPEPVSRAAPPRTLLEAVYLPMTEFLKRQHAIEILIFILLFKIGDSMAAEMFNPFYLGIGFTKSEIGGIAKLFGFWSSIAGGLLGGAIMIKIGIGRALWLFGILQMFSTAGFSVLASIGNSQVGLATVVTIECICTGMATSAYVAFMASLCDRRFTATQYALFSSLMGVPRVIFGSSTGYLAKTMGWHGFFLFCTILHLPGLFMLLRRNKWSTAAPAT